MKTSGCYTSQSNICINSNGPSFSQLSLKINNNELSVMFIRNKASNLDSFKYISHITAQKTRIRELYAKSQVVKLNFKENREAKLVNYTAWIAQRKR